MEAAELMLTVARTAAVYVLMLIVIRALGKRTVGNFSAFDLLVALMLGEVVDEIIYGDVRFIQGAIAIVAIGALAYADAWLAYWDHGMEAVLEGKPTIVVRVVVAYVVLLVLVRVRGKRTMRQGSPFDFAVALILGDLIDDLLWAEVHASLFVMAAGMLMFAHTAFALVRYRMGHGR
jgi:uncharacterized membrane protein YcaP (DUF421 family)